ncbi:hypothetical protein [Micromonospora taraxaci]
MNVEGTLYNYGALGFTEGSVDSNGGTSVSRRSGPGTGDPDAARLAYLLSLQPRRAAP